MGNKDKKSHKKRAYSRSRSRERDRKTSHKAKKSKNRESNSNSSRDSSPEIRISSKSSKARSPAPERLTWSQKEELKEGQKEQLRLKKQQMKLIETPEEKRARRLAKKEMKERKRKEKMGWDDEYLGYTNTDNPFGDERLLDTFVWNKKLEKEGKKDVPRSEIQKMQKEKLLESKIELEKVKQRRLQREQEMEERQKEQELEQRDKELEYYSAWEKQEDTFHLSQAKLRSTIRIADGRAKPIDLLAKYINAEDEDMSVEMHEPYTYLNGLTKQDLDDLLEDINVYMNMEIGRNTEYWKDITTIAEDEISKLRRIDPNTRDYVGERRTGINTAVSKDVESIFKGKTLSQLEILENSIKQKLSGGDGIDVGYWEHLLSQLKAHVARTRLREKHKEQLQRKLFKLKMEQGIGSDPLFPILKEEKDRSRQGSPATTSIALPQTGVEDIKKEDSVVSNDEPQPGTSREELEAASAESDENDNADDDNLVTEDDVQEQLHEEYENGNYSPVLLRQSDLEPDQLVYDPEDDIKRLEYARRHFMKTGRTEDTEGDFVKKAKEGMDDDEAQFSVEVPVEKTNMLWSDKYRPRKPRFFNRVHTGFEWNKYNQTHYDIDNPPPKIVQGYKFNIFYPDLIDKTQTPQYTLIPIENQTDFATLRFRAGPPYEDIAFKVVNREWEYSYKRGFRCQFHNNIFQLWYHFKRYRYRR